MNRYEIGSIWYANGSFVRIEEVRGDAIKVSWGKPFGENRHTNRESVWVPESYFRQVASLRQSALKALQEVTGY
jgi:hypothetical protein